MASAGRCGRLRRSSLQSLWLSGRRRPARPPVFSSSGLIFVFLSTSVWFAASLSFCWFVFSHLPVAVFLTFLAHSSTPFVFLSLQLRLPSGVCSSFSLDLASVGAMVNKKVQIQYHLVGCSFSAAFKPLNTIHRICVTTSFQGCNSAKLENT